MNSLELLEQEKILYNAKGKFLYRGSKITREQFNLLNSNRLLEMKKGDLWKEFGETIKINDARKDSFFVKIVGQREKAIMCFNSTTPWNPCLEHQERGSTSRHDQRPFRGPIYVKPNMTTITTDNSGANFPKDPIQSALNFSDTASISCSFLKRKKAFFCIVEEPPAVNSPIFNQSFCAFVALMVILAIVIIIQFFKKEE